MSHYEPVNRQQGENIVLAHAAYGEPVTATMRPNSHGENIQQVQGNILAAADSYESPEEIAERKAKIEAQRESMRKAREAKAAKAAQRAAERAEKKRLNAEAAKAYSEGDERKLDEIREQWDQIG